MPLEDHHSDSFISLYSKAMDTYGMVDRVVGEVVHLVNSGKHRIVCRRGCNTCCTVFVRATFAEAAAIARWLFEPSNAGMLGRFRGKLAGWHKAAGPEVEMLEALATRHGIHLDSGADSQLFSEAVLAYHRRKLMCPFNADDGSCGVYTFRPIVCRAFFVVGASENCALDGNGEAGIVRNAKLTEIVFSGQEALREASAAAGYGTISALPVGVHRAISYLERFR